MKYMGSKSRIAKYIVPIIQGYIDTGYENYLEPFVGGANIIDKIQCKNKYGFDKQSYLIELYNNLDKLSSLPQFITREHYEDVKNCYLKNDKKYEQWYTGAVGFLSSYNGRFFDGGYAGIAHTKIGTERNYYDEAKRNLLKQSILLKDTKFECHDFSDLVDIKNCVIYCDPPYENTTKYNSSKDFNHDKFWQWCRDMSKENIVLISEQNCPEDFSCILQMDVKRTLDNKKRASVYEKLFMYKR